ncbi:hypothetical protein ACHAWX_000347 [Stephanocyclus meneghinianus]
MNNIDEYIEMMELPSLGDNDIEQQGISVSNGHDNEDPCIDNNKTAAETKPSTSSSLMVDNGECLDNHGKTPNTLQQQESPPRRNHHHQHSNTHATRNYMFLITIAFVLTLSCPATNLWDDSISMCSKSSSNVTSADEQVGVMNEKRCDSVTLKVNSSLADSYASAFAMMYGPIHVRRFIKLTIHAVGIIISYFMVHGSDPGVLNEESMKRLNDLDNFEVILRDQNPTGLYFVSSRGGTYADSQIDDTQRQSFLEPLPSPPKPTSPLHEDRPRSIQSQSSAKGIQHPTIICQSTRRKYCTKCGIHPPLRSHHCNICNACIATFDHHCLFLNTCIGERNHFRFWMFLALNVAGLNYALEIVSSGNVDKALSLMDSGDGDTTSDMHLIGVLILLLSKMYLYPIFIVATILFTVHTALALGNSTSFEFGKAAGHIDYLRGTRMMDFPFSTGVCNNIRIFFQRDNLSQVLHFRCKNEIRQKINNYDRFQLLDMGWTPILWRMPVVIDRDSEEWWNHPWQNKYWSCC